MQLSRMDAGAAVPRGRPSRQLRVGWVGNVRPEAGCCSGRCARRSAHPLFPGRSSAHKNDSVCSNLVHRNERKDPLPRYEYSPRHVVEARYLGDYKVWLEFNDGRKGVVDLSDELHGEERSPLRNRELFSSFYLDYGLASIAWLDGADFAPEFLYEKLKAMN